MKTIEDLKKENCQLWWKVFSNECDMARRCTDGIIDYAPVLKTAEQKFLAELKHV